MFIGFFKKIMLIESIILIGLYFVINNMLPILLMKKILVRSYFCFCCGRGEVWNVTKLK